ncbi:MAG: S8 family serine peptidase [Pseudomonadales bacterium]|nr:S8 family serine peptidase [Pseudomonadales bacterium]
MRRSHLLLTGLVSVLLLVGGCSSAPRTQEERLARQVMFTVPERNPDAALTTAYATADLLNIARNQDTSQPVIGRIMSMHRLRKVAQWPIKALGIEAIIAEIRGNDRSVEEVIAALARDERVESAQPVVTYDLLSYNDPYFHLQTGSVPGADIEQVHRIATGKDVVVAVVDTGVDRKHPELVDHIILSRNFVDDDQSRFDGDEHGTSVAGIIGSTANNDLGIVGIAPEVKMMVFKSCWQDRLTRRAKCDSYSIMKALVEVLKQQPDVLNLSLSGPPDPMIRRLLSAAIDRGIIVVAAVDPDHESFPASMQRVIAVSAPFGMPPNLAQMPKNAVIAPGTDILTTTPGATYAFRSGSSMATAYVSGVAALMKELRPTLSGEQLRAQLLATSHYSVDMVPVVDMCRAVVGDNHPDTCSTGTVVAHAVKACSDCERAPL